MQQVFLEGIVDQQAALSTPTLNHYANIKSQGQVLKEGRDVVNPASNASESLQLYQYDYSLLMLIIRPWPSHISWNGLLSYNGTWSWGACTIGTCGTETEAEYGQYHP